MVPSKNDSKVKETSGWDVSTEALHGRGEGGEDGRVHTNRIIGTVEKVGHGISSSILQAAKSLIPSGKKEGDNTGLFPAAKEAQVAEGENPTKRSSEDVAAPNILKSIPIIPPESSSKKNAALVGAIASSASVVNAGATKETQGKKDGAMGVVPEVETRRATIWATTFAGIFSRPSIQEEMQKGESSLAKQSRADILRAQGKHAISSPYAFGTTLIKALGSGLVGLTKGVGKAIMAAPKALAAIPSLLGAIPAAIGGLGSALASTALPAFGVGLGLYGMNELTDAESAAAHLERSGAVVKRTESGEVDFNAEVDVSNVNPDDMGSVLKFLTADYKMKTASDRGFVANLKLMFSELWDGYKGIVSKVWDGIKAVPSMVASGVMTGGRWVVNFLVKSGEALGNQILNGFVGGVGKGIRGNMDVLFFPSEEESNQRSRELTKKQAEFNALSDSGIPFEVLARNPRFQKDFTTGSGKTPEEFYRTYLAEKQARVFVDSHQVDADLEAKVQEIGGLIKKEVATPYQVPPTQQQPEGQVVAAVTQQTSEQINSLRAQANYLTYTIFSAGNIQFRWN